MNTKRNMVFSGSLTNKTAFIAVLIFLGIQTPANAQPAENKTISVNTSATELLPANRIIFTVNINAEADNPQEAYNLHKKREKVLAGLLKQFNIIEEHIEFEPIRMHKQNASRYGNEKESINTRTNQMVSVTFNDFNIYEKIQVELINNGFDSFSGNFTSNQVEEGKDKALAKAIQKAREKAGLIAKAAGVALGDISSINYSDYQVQYGRQSDMMELNVSTGSPSMMDFNQTVSVTASISIEFLIK